MGSFEYDYKNRKAEIEKVIDDMDKINKVERIPKSEDKFTYTNGYKAWTTAIFVDIRNSTQMFATDSDEEELNVARTIRGFTSEIIEILRKDTGTELLEIGIRGDCVYAIYSTKTTSEITDIYTRACYVNTYIKMLNKILAERNLDEIKAGIGIGASESVAVKAGRKYSGVNSLVWIGKAVSEASKLSNMSSKDGIGPIAISGVVYTNILKYYNSFQDKNKSTSFKSFFTKIDSKNSYHGNVIIKGFNAWVENGMK